MKRRLLTFALAALTVGLLGSCSKINERIDGLDKRVYDLENRIASVDQQITLINQSIADLENIRTNIQALMEAKTALEEDVTALKTADQTLEGKINDLKDFVDTELANYATKEWANATFATLAKQEEIVGDITKLKEDLAGLDAELDKAISDLDSSLKSWVNTQLSAYYTAAQMDTKLAGLQSDIDSLKAGGEVAEGEITELEEDLATLSQELDSAKVSIKAAYEKAIKDAIDGNGGFITETIKNAIDEANGKITDLTGRVETLETTVAALSGDVDALKAMIQSVSITPAYSDGSVKAEDGILTLKCVVSPAEALGGIESTLKDSLLIYADSVKVKNKTKGEASAYMEIKVSEATVTDAKQGAITLTADISEYLPKEEDEALAVALNIRNGISNFTTEFVPVYAIILPAAKIGETTYRTLEEAINAVGEDETIEILKDIKDATGIEIPENKDFTLDFGEHTYTVTGPGAGPDNAAFDIPGSSDVVFKDGTIECSDDNKDKGSDGITTIISNNGDTTLEDMNIDGENLANDGDDRSPLIKNNGGTLTIGDEDGDEGTYTNDGPVLIIEDGDVTIEDGTFTSTDDTTIIADGGDVDIKDGDYTGEDGTVGFPDKDADITIKGGNHTSEEGPVLWGNDSPKNDDERNTLTIEGGWFKCGPCTDNAPTGVFIPGNDTVIIKGGEFDVPGEDPDDPGDSGGVGVVILDGTLEIIEHPTFHTPMFHCGDPGIPGTVWGIPVNPGHDIVIIYDDKGGDPDVNITPNPDDYDVSIIGTPPSIPVTGVTLSKTTLSLIEDETVTLTATVAPENATNKNVTWSSDKIDIAIVDTVGKVTAVAAGTATITVTTVDGAKTATCTVTVTSAPELPAGALTGGFTVNAEGKKVYFSKGNLYAKKESGEWKWHFYDEQYNYNSLNSNCVNGMRTATADDTEIDLFTWGYDAANSFNPIGQEYVGGHITEGDRQLSRSEDWGSQIGDGDTWRTLTSEEWMYMLSYANYTNNIRQDRHKNLVTVCGKTNCLIIAPDNWDLTAHPLQSEYSTTSTPMTWAQAEAAGLVCLPAASSRVSGIYVGIVGDQGFYCTSSALNHDAIENMVRVLLFDTRSLSPACESDRGDGYSVRLVTEGTSTLAPPQKVDNPFGNGTEQEW